MINLNAVKMVTAFVASAGVSAVVKNAIKATTPFDQKLYNKIMVNVGTVFIGAVLSNQAAKYTSDVIDETASQYEQVKDNINNLKQQNV
jgi:hypothetical protein